MPEDKDLREAGLKVTAPRLKILRVLESSARRHMSAEDVYRALLDAGEELNLATIYRVLTQFEAAGLVTRLRFEGGHSTFELDSGQHHDHILCVVCGRVDEFVDDVIEHHQSAIAERLGYRMTDHSLHIYGICASCRDKGAASHPPDQAR
ncbi:MAG TPA: ferric iron uptake transcriptional regulator, partial [Gammaproteobacteria bacterium]|nr:ferric iron uptake transcriptional regulator [Gammaproteobacteria bacterium]